MFDNVQQAIAVYSSDELDVDDDTGGGDNNVQLKNWLEEGRKQLDAAREALQFHCEPVAPPREVEQFLHYFCGDAANPIALNETEPLRVVFYKTVAAFVRAFAAIAQNLDAAGYSDAEATALRAEVIYYSDIRSAVKNCSGEEFDPKPYEADMRHLINTYIQADPAFDVGELSELPLTELIVATGIHDAIARRLNEKGNLSQNAIAEEIINNVRKTIIRDQLTDPRFYERMSQLLDDLIQQSRANTAEYEEFLRKATALAQQLVAGQSAQGVPSVLHGKPEAAVIFNNLPDILSLGQAVGQPGPSAGDEDERAGLALRIELAVRDKAPANWRGDQPREAEVLNAIFPLLGGDRDATLALFEMIKNQPGY